MEEREATKSIQRKRSNSSSLTESASSSSLSLPLDLANEIFLRLNVKSILRFRCASKVWSSITTTPYFNNSLEARQNLLFFFKVGNKFFVFTIRQHNRNPNESYSYSSSQTYDSYHITYPEDWLFTVRTESDHGLICFQKVATYKFWNFIVWNPTMRKFLDLRLRKPDSSWRDIRAFLGYDPVEGKHKLVCMSCYYKAYDEGWVITLGSDPGSWRTVKTNYKHNLKDGKSICINGVLYYGAYTDSEDRVIMSFDVRCEKLDVIKVPWGKKFDPVLLKYEGRLACVVSIGNILSMWVLEDARKGEWSSHNFLPLSHYDRVSKNLFKVIGMTNDGELIYVPKTLLESFQVIYIDPKRKTFRRVNYQGIADREFRQRNGLGDKRLYSIQYLPNHIESLTM